MNDNWRAIRHAQSRFAEAVRQHQAIPPAAEWLLDNYYIIQENLRAIQQDLSGGYYRELAKLANGLWAGYPRTYALAIELIAHTDSRLDIDTLTRFVCAYEETQPLAMGELWALPIMLRLGLVENLRRLIDDSLVALAARQKADRWADQLVLLARRPKADFLISLALLARSHSAADPLFGVQLLQRLRDQDPAVAPAIHWLTERLGEQTSVEAVIRADHFRRATNRVSTGNVISSMRLLSTVDWNTFFESTSIVDSVLREDPSGTYPQMEWRSRDEYRHVVERLARAVTASEEQIARAAVELARRKGRAPEQTPAVEELRQRHVGYYLIDDGLPELQSSVHYVPKLRERLVTRIIAHPTGVYLGPIFVLTFLLVATLVGYAASIGASPFSLLWIAVWTGIPASAIVIAAVNWTITTNARPRVPPRLEFHEIPANYRTMVAVPALLSDVAGIEQLVLGLETRFLTNQDPHLHFALLGDFADSPESHMPEDKLLIDYAIRRISELNARYAPGGADRFYFFHRQRQWDPGEGTWMGWERKRGKLIEFDRLLRGADTNYHIRLGDPSILPQIKFVITLDADTVLPPDAAKRLIGTLAHPLNHANVDPALRRVVKGYGIIQPRTAHKAPHNAESLFVRIFAGDTGLDPYATASSNVYQDLFGSGSYVGKAIYDVDVALAVLDCHFPPNWLLSHDLLEGAFARTGLASDIELLEDYPSSYDAFTQREHRWIRGDWQIADWLLPRVPDAQGKQVSNTLPLVERWKILDNLRRSLLSTGILILLITGWLFLPGPPLVWTGIALGGLLAPLFIDWASNVSNRPTGEPLKSYLWAIGESTAINAMRGLLLLAFLVFDASISLHAFLQAGWRRFMTHRHMLHWRSFEAVEKRQTLGVFGYWIRMGIAPVLAGLLLPFVLGAPAALPLAAPILALWFFSPAIAFGVSEPAPVGFEPLPAEAEPALRMTARQIWHFYDTLATAEDHWLPPDNYDASSNRIAHRTSPTNIGFLVLSTLAAFDFGYLGLYELAERWEKTFATLDRLERYRGHFLNWYDTTTLQPLYPRYVSTVDSGNLAACLIVVEQACLEISDAPQVDLARAVRGIQDTIRVLQRVLARLDDPGDASGPARQISAMSALLDTMAHASSEALASTEAHASTELSEDQLGGLTGHSEALLEHERQLEAELGGVHLTDIRYWCEAFARQVGGLQKEIEGLDNQEQAISLLERYRGLGARARAYSEAMDFAFLHDDQRRVFATGYNLDSNRLDNSYYDLLESEARLSSLLAIARGQVPAQHWFKLGRPLTRVQTELTLLSWGGTMFEYLMPLLLLREYERTLLHQSSHSAIRRQIQYGRAHGVPWGISESGFYAFDAQQNYQYRLFGVPDLGLRRETSPNLVIAPYATFLALPFAPRAAWENLRRLEQEGMRGDYGYFEAIDYTPSRRPRDRRAGIVRSFMAHHQGMSLVALDNALNGDAMRRRFHADPAVVAVNLLLQERIPQHAPLTLAHPEGRTPEIDQSEHRVLTTRRFTTPHTAAPRFHLLSNGAYSVMLTNTGAGYSAYQDRLVTRWRQDLTRDAAGTFCFIRDVASRQVWSAGYQPTTCKPEEGYETIFAPDKVEFHRRDYGIETVMEVTVSPRDNVEIRRMSLLNHSGQPRELELTSYAEVALDTLKADLAHPAFAKLFVQTEYEERGQILLFKRRQRTEKESPLWAAHCLCIEGRANSVIRYETDRARFLGRGNLPATAQAIQGRLSNTVGAVLDPIMSLRCRVRLAPGETARVSFITLVADARQAALDLCATHADPRAVEETFDLAYAHSQVQLRHLNISAEDAHLFQHLAGLIVFPDPGVRVKGEIALQNTQGQAGLWSYGISGDYPLVLVEVDAFDEIDLVRQALHAHEFLRLHNFVFDLVILDGQGTSYVEGLHGQLQALIDTSLSRPWADKPGGIYLRRADTIPEQDRVLIQTLARVVLDGELGSLASQLDRTTRLAAVLTSRDTMALSRQARWARRREDRGTSPPQFSLPHLPHRVAPTPPRLQPGPIFNNGVGGFSPDGREYVISVNRETRTPAPWTNILANPSFGCLVTESGLGYTWAENSQMNKLTPWSNDPISDPSGEAIYLRDEETGEFWSATPLPAHGQAPYRIRHGAGYSIFEHTSRDLAQELVVFVPRQDPVKVMRLRVRNLTARRRRLSLTSYAEWVLGVNREQGHLFVATEMDAAHGVFLARSVYIAEHPVGNGDCTGRVAFTCMNRPVHSFTGDRSEFLGRTGSCAAPVGMLRARLAGRVGFGLDPCAALRTQMELGPGEETEWTLVLGESDDRKRALELAERYRDSSRVKAELDTARAAWNELLETVQVKTPEPAMDILLNRWLLYQTLACRVWGRSAFYQSGGAYGFRDQLQDVLALILAAPQVAREHILRSAAHQFREGDVQHWWQPPGGQGLRTRFSDDYLWLPYAAAEYLRSTGDEALLEELVPFLQAPPLALDQHEAYGTATVSDEQGTVYEHCVRAIDHGLAFGEHGLPLMGDGDWNDGMNRVGSGGKGESVWLGWFLYSILDAFVEIAAARHDEERAINYREQAARLRQALEEHGWDGEWYRRAFFDDGTALGSKENEECQIDSIAQSWAVLSGAAPEERARAALQAVENKLVKERDRLLLLLTPPFDQPAHDPGYIKGYVPGVRENGGQYTHAALWVVRAWTQLGNGDRATELYLMLNPINHSRTPEQTARYAVEPYVIAADVYTESAHVGRGGWTWYTGSAGWMYRVGIEDILGLKRRGSHMVIDPCIPRHWREYQITWRFGSARYEISVQNPKGVNRGVKRVELDGQELAPSEIPLVDDNATHRVKVTLGQL